MATKSPAKAPAQGALPTLHVGLTLLEVSEPHLLDGLRSDRHLAPYIEGLLSPTVAVIRCGGEEALLKQLRRLGYFPQVQRPGGAP